MKTVHTIKQWNHQTIWNTSIYFNMQEFLTILLYIICISHFSNTNQQWRHTKGTRFDLLSFSTQLYLNKPNSVFPLEPICWIGDMTTSPTSYPCTCGSSCNPSGSINFLWWKKWCTVTGNSRISEITGHIWKEEPPYARDVDSKPCSMWLPSKAGHKSQIKLR